VPDRVADAALAVERHDVRRTELLKIIFGMLTAVVVVSESIAGGQGQTTGPSGQSGLVYEGSASFWVDVPRGWILDSEAGRRDGPIVVLYRTGTTWQTSEPVMYANVSRATGAQPLTAREAANADITKWRNDVRDVVVKEVANLTTAGGQTALIRKFASAAEKRYESVAYIPGPQRVWVLVLSARSARNHDTAYPVFLRFVKSHAPGPPVKLR
jgi:hypothetical protein